MGRHGRRGGGALSGSLSPLAAAAIALLAAACTVAPPPALQAPGGEATARHALRWTTASEVDTFGFDVYRAELPEGPFEKVTERPILGAGTSDQHHQYRFVDEGVDPDATYYYYVESIGLDGSRERLTPILRAGPKPSVEPAASGARGNP